MVINPSSKQRGFHSGDPWVWQLSHLLVERAPGRGDRTFLDNRAIRLAHTAADALFVYVQANTGLFTTLGNITTDSAGNLFFADSGNNRVFKIDTAGNLTVVAGNGLDGYSGDGGPAISASLSPFGVAVDASGNVFFSDVYNSVVRKVSPAGLITTIAGG